MFETTVDLSHACVNLCRKCAQDSRNSALDSVGKTNIGQLEEKCVFLNSVVNSVLFAEVGGRSFSAKLHGTFFPC